jgi:hypothetical protein
MCECSAKTAHAHDCQWNGHAPQAIHFASGGTTATRASATLPGAGHGAAWFLSENR